jgi:hypothetical protein
MISPAAAALPDFPERGVNVKIVGRSLWGDNGHFGPTLVNVVQGKWVYHPVITNILHIPPGEGPARDGDRRSRAAAALRGDRHSRALGYLSAKSPPEPSTSRHLHVT